MRSAVPKAGLWIQTEPWGFGILNFIYNAAMPWGDCLVPLGNAASIVPDLGNCEVVYWRTGASHSIGSVFSVN